MADIQIQQETTSSLEVDARPKHRHDDIYVDMVDVAEGTVEDKKTGPKTSVSMLHMEYRCPQCQTEVALDMRISSEVITTSSSDQPGVFVTHRTMWVDPE